MGLRGLFQKVEGCCFMPAFWPNTSSVLRDLTPTRLAQQKENQFSSRDSLAPLQIKKGLYPRGYKPEAL